VFNWIFSVVFTGEVLLKLVFLRCTYIKVPMNWIDIVAVLVGLLADLAEPWLGNIGNPMVVRLLRLAKMERGLRVLKVSRVLDNLSLILKCLAASLTTLFWSLCLLTVIQCIAGMILSSMVRDYIMDESQDLLKRAAVFKYYGTFTKSMLTMFEVTFANWAPACRVLVDNINEWYTLFFLLYRCTVGFAVLGVISAVFIQQTMRTADRDMEILLARKRTEQEDYTGLLRQLFRRIDKSGDGLINYEEFREMRENEAMRAWMIALEIGHQEAEGLWAVCVNDDGEMSFDMFLEGALRVKGPAKSFDMVRVMGDIRRMQEQLCVALDPGRARDPGRKRSGSPTSPRMSRPLRPSPPRGALQAPASVSTGSTMAPAGPMSTTGPGRAAFDRTDPTS